MEDRIKQWVGFSRGVIELVAPLRVFEQNAVRSRIFAESFMVSKFKGK